MGVKRVNLDPNFHPKKRGKAMQNDDWLSGLPDDVLIDILSSLSLREAARTSVLSSRWTNLWRHSSCLNFDGDELCNDERREYIDWVNSVLRSHKAPRLDEFRICFDLDESCRKAVTSWLEFAFARRVQRLELTLVEYDFAELFRRSTSKAPSFNYKSLKSLCLSYVNVSGEDIELFLHNCPFLEQLIVRDSYKMSKVEVCGSSLALKRLEIVDCYPIGTPVKISAPNLTSLKVKTLTALLLENVPMLVEFNLIRVRDGVNMQKLVHGLHCYISELEVLTLDLFSTYKEYELYNFPQMPKLKKLGIRFTMARGDKSLMRLTSYLRASPHLQEFEVTVIGATLSRKKREVENVITHSPHQHLKVLKFFEYFGRPSDFELVRYILMNCMALQKIVIDPCYEIGIGRRNARNYAKRQLKAVVPPHIQLLIL
ncbi:hypothetical protein ACS0TY_015848 [Phlomoides rotata]